MENWAEIRRRVFVDGLSRRAACREYGIHWDTLKRILEQPEPPGYHRATVRPKPKLDPFRPVIDQILRDEKKAQGSSGTPQAAGHPAALLGFQAIRRHRPRRPGR